MASYVAFNPGVEVSGSSMISLFAAMGRYDVLGRKILERRGILRVLPEEWYPQQVCLDVYKGIAYEIGENMLFSIGKKVAEQAKWPPGIQRIEQGLALLDDGYHMNHRLDGELMLNPRTGEKKKGIGSYVVQTDGLRSAFVIANTPYPSDFDRGVIAGVARMWRPLADVALDESKASRKRGGDSCTYRVMW